MIIRVLALGDTVGDGGVSYLADRARLKNFIKENGVMLTVCNGENSARGNGITPTSAEGLFDAGVDIITGGNHTWQRHEIYGMLDSDTRLVRPANFPGSAPGCGDTVVDVLGYRILIFNLSGNAFMTEYVASPFEWAEKVLTAHSGDYDLSVLDFHAETTSEKVAMGHFLDGRVSAVFGTHTHVATADIKVLPEGTGYITDLGMCGSHSGVLGVKTECILHKFTVHTPCRFEPSEGQMEAHGAVFDLDTDTGLCKSAFSVTF